MQCPRLEHFVRLDYTGKIGKCGHMTKGKTFDSIDDMQNSEWLKDIKNQMSEDHWPKECVRCEMTENTSNTSIRLDMIQRDRLLKGLKKDYLIVGGVLDNICNGACQSCSPDLSTKIGSLYGKDYKQIDNYHNFTQLPQDRIVELDINGGEPTASPAYKKLLMDLPESVKIVRVNTNGSLMIPEIPKLLQKGVRVIITLSFDGVGSVHDYTRWPVTWKKFSSNVQEYIKLKTMFKNLRLNTWTTVTSLNVGDLHNILDYTRTNQLDHAYGFCIRPEPLDIRASNSLTMEAKEKFKNSEDLLLRSIASKCATLSDNTKQLKNFIETQDRLRKISYRDYFNFLLK